MRFYSHFISVFSCSLFPCRLGRIPVGIWVGFSVRILSRCETDGFCVRPVGFLWDFMRDFSVGLMKDSLWDSCRISCGIFVGVPVGLLQEFLWDMSKFLTGQSLSKWGTVPQESSRTFSLGSADRTLSYSGDTRVTIRSFLGYSSLPRLPLCILLNRKLLRKMAQDQWNWQWL